MAVVRRHYYDVDVVATRGGPQSTFTYHSDQRLVIGQIVYARLAQRSSLGVVRKTVTKPAFPTKPVEIAPNIRPLSANTLALADWISSYYVAPLGLVWQNILPKASLNVKPAVATRKSKSPATKSRLVPTKAQVTAIKKIDSSVKRTYLLHGATGSGKTQVYIELARRSFERDQSVIILVPEIALTPQLIAMLTSELGSKAILTHSKLSPARRRDIWLQIQNAKEPIVVVGPRSALFSPVSNLGYIIIDEAHDTSYKQDQSPRYHTQAVAAYMAQMYDAKLVLGSATPSLSSIFLAKRGELELVEMKQPIHRAILTPASIIDLRDRSKLRRSNSLSEPLIGALEQTLATGKQSILFLNRRGSARLLICRNCGWKADCPNCLIPLTWHADSGKLICHWCAYETSPPAVCPSCQSLDFKYAGTGTKQIEEELKRLLPTARLKRLDKDSFEPKTLEATYHELRSGKIDILIGTQMVTKGLDIAGIETVGVILADSSLYLPDYTAAEKTFQLLYQVSGRAGRRTGSRSHTFIQTHSPTHPAILAGANRDYDGFYQTEIAERKTHSYPPFSYLMKLWITKPTREQAEQSALQLANNLKTQSQSEEFKFRVIGPAPAWHETYARKYRWQIIVSSPRRDSLVRLTKDIPRDSGFDLDPSDLL